MSVVMFEKQCKAKLKQKLKKQKRLIYHFNISTEYC